MYGVKLAEFDSGRICRLHNGFLFSYGKWTCVGSRGIRIGLIRFQAGCCIRQSSLASVC